MFHVLCSGINLKSVVTAVLPRSPVTCHAVLSLDAQGPQMLNSLPTHDGAHSDFPRGQFLASPGDGPSAFPVPESL